MKRFIIFTMFLHIFISIIDAESDICILCDCAFLEADNPGSNIINVQCSSNTGIELENIMWPSGNVKIHAKLNNLNENLLPRINGHLNLIELNLDNNTFRNVVIQPFKNLISVEVFSYANIPTDFFVESFLDGMENLTKLSLSNTTISNISPKMMLQAKKLIELDLTHNEFNKLSAKHFDALKNVEKINLSHNKIGFIDGPNENVILNIKEINVSYNRLSTIQPSVLKTFLALEVLDASHNFIEHIDSDSFSKASKLRVLDLSYNQIIRFTDFVLGGQYYPLEILNLGSNQILELSFSEEIKMIELHLENNQLDKIPQTDFSELTFLNVSNNNIKNLPNIKFPKLKLLDLSDNQLTAVPQGMSQRSKVLETLILDNNPIEVIEYVDETILMKLSMNRMALIKRIDHDSFRYVFPGRNDEISSGDCLDLSISHCPQLKTIHELSFSNIELCSLDLSYNQLETIPPKLTNWTSIKGDINLQGNPWDCNCESQWMLDQILKTLYENKSKQILLKELKCGGPGQFTGHRFVKYLKRRQEFCDPTAAMIKDEPVKAAKIFDGGARIHVDFSRGPNYITIIISSIVILVALIMLGLYWTKMQNRQLQKESYKRNRRYETEAFKL